MKINVIGNVNKEEVDSIVKEETERLAAKGKEVATIEIAEVSPEELGVKITAKSNIKRVRRITGYLSTIDRFNDTKQDELEDRVVHNFPGCRC
ncbi:anaerobic ribonucleoside-triphosphate reductase [Desulforamulus ferrireducens]|uniref:Uncharacterized protein n=1 Tax=Desulforamulus ferrireducens TaxID=1833852 RepID=A0A1S6IUG8_9FIRM|nr:anaerobic ribonucleoside-triphosphate reductase [Desulforamulus ferrireducens]AQS58420.1 hypothetical protein B0537_04530 [Desulforamulus ferrireducens]